MQNDPKKWTITTPLILIGGKWTAVILWHPPNQARRCSELQHLIPAITQKMLTQQLGNWTQMTDFASTSTPKCPARRILTDQRWSDTGLGPERNGALGLDEERDEEAVSDH